MVKTTLNFDELPDASFVRQPTVESLFACSSSTVWRWVKLGILPKPLKVGGITAWKVGEIREVMTKASQREES